MEEKQLYWYFERKIDEITDKKTWAWLRKWKWKRETESLQIAAKNNDIKTNHVKAKIDKAQQNSKWGLWGEKDETIDQIISESSKLKEVKDKVRLSKKAINLELCKRTNFDHTVKLYVYKQEYFQENGIHNILWDF